MKHPPCKRQLLEALSALRAEIHHELDTRTLSKLDEVIELLQHNDESIERRREIIYLLGVFIESLPQYAAILKLFIG
ncbi:MAG: hypothetical protein DHS20C09_20910 [marine bacterium B5-7]|nr:MAG: hypothetical protein DHS20C09_20910 [marine bacterium B5-7]